MDDVKIFVKGLTVGYTSPIICDIDFVAHGGEIVTLIGPNGSGKSTVLKTLSGSLKKIDGTVKFMQKDTDSMTSKERARLVSALLTENVTAPLMTVREVVEMGRYPYTGYFGTLSNADKFAVEEALQITKVSEFSDKYFNTLSDGQKQRTLLARALCQEPQILILDEPTSYLDIHHKIAFLEILKRLVKEKNITVVMSLHELDFVKEISDSVICLKDGGVFCKGRTAEIFGRGTITGLFDISDEMYKRYINL